MASSSSFVCNRSFADLSGIGADDKLWNKSSVDGQQEAVVVITDCDSLPTSKTRMSNLSTQLAEQSATISAADRKSSLWLQVPCRNVDSVNLGHSSISSSGSASILSFTSGFINSIQYPTAIIRCSDMRLLHYNDLAVKLFGYGSDELADGALHFTDLFPSFDCQGALPGIAAMKTHRRRLSCSVSGGSAGLQTRSSGNQNALSKSHDTSAPAAFLSLHNLENNQAPSANPVNQLIKAQLKDGSTVWVELSLSPISNEYLQSPIVNAAPVTDYRPSSSRMSSCDWNEEQEEEQYLLATIRELSSLETHSRYENEFIEMEMIGKGGFGTVYRALNKIDGQEYAIKKVHLDSYNGDLSNDKFIREVQTFARISNHPNVVRYYAAWTEPVVRRVSLKPKKSAPALRPSYLTDGEFDDDLLFASDSPQMSASVGSSPVKPRFRQKPSKKTHKLSINYPETSSYESTVLAESWKQQNEMLSSLLPAAKSSHHKKINKTKSSKTVASAILYIQMQFCPYNDLRKWIDSRSNAVNIHDNLEIAKQILEGLDYIHGQGFVHRDIKPENIFYQDGRVYLGDFGLARSTTAHEQEHDENEEGTFLYRAPEFFDARHPANIASSADIYSLGIVFLELFLKFKTGMERAVTLTEAHQGRLSEELGKYPRVKELIVKMLNHAADKRPSARDLLNIISKRITDLRRPGEIFTTDLVESGKSAAKTSPSSKVDKGFFRRWSSNEIVNRPSLTPPTSPHVTSSSTSTMALPAFQPLSPQQQGANAEQKNIAAIERQRIKELERQVQMLNKELQALKTSIALKDTPSPPTDTIADKTYFTLPLRRTSTRNSLSLLGTSPNAKASSSASSLSLIHHHLISQQQNPSK